RQVCRACGEVHACRIGGQVRCALMALLLVGCSRQAPDVVVVQGTVEVRQVDVAPFAAGRVLRVLVDEGDHVRAGDTIAVLDAPTLEADLGAARARVAAAEAALADLSAGPRQPELAIARAELAAARTDSARLAREAAR